ncbi:hypothetical protein METBIDRAFT_41465 [Metschnikowia bicuspidata var. bicuspidata NRRL YB-4993]|uniref:DNA-directed RNA polymerase subunit n=1 Tax=Metschnikowia bicuspidata var. bicuspidata NRRL YB-4993 TaxID=869754 RepID=A0A1A0HCL7_9ASCO|nr:hypothetical protein METBIDRAFT_41465 [Metschnikowia bicuspidata var. bicuspidata NRRL YB-4993]OBA21726.1 hypothetical protein METBIDRAFT_41465 [Metschnikowia bicuspidata var. bicuspidata NRRL YB-4993]
MSVEAKAVEKSFHESEFKGRNPRKSTNVVNEKGQSDCFRVVRTSMYVSLAPCHIENPLNGVKAQHLDPLIMTYFPKARGVVLSYFNINLESKGTSEDALSVILAKVTDSSAFSFMWIAVDLLIWCPQIGDLLEGFVYMQTASHIGLLIHDTFNASIKFRNIPQDWEFVPVQADEYAESEASPENNSSKFKSFGYWTDASGAKIEGKVPFTVKAIHTSGRMLSIEGTLLTPESELDAQPVLREGSSSKADVTVSAGKHITFDDEETPEATEAADSKTEAVPSYEAGSGDNVDSSSSEDNAEESE